MLSLGTARLRSLCSAAIIKSPQEFLTLQAGMSAAEVLSQREALIVAPSPSVMQQAKRPESSVWLLKFEPANRWSNPLMGWTSTRDPLASIRISFDSKESAINFAESQGIKFRVLDPHLKKRTPKSYSTNFKWKGNSGTEQ